MASNVAHGDLSQPESDADAWQIRKSVLDCNKHMLENQIKCDLTFTFGEKNEDDMKSVTSSVSCHSYMLISRSPVFYAMLAGPARDESGTINIPDIDKDTFKEMLRFIYYEQTTINGNNVLGLLYTAKKYMLPELEDKCKDFLDKELAPSNVCPVLDQACTMGDEPIIQKCLAVIDENTEETFASDCFVNLDADSLQKILPRDSLGTVEIHIWRACCTWAEKESMRRFNNNSEENKRKVLGDMLYQIRFPTMGMKEFVDEVANNDILSDKEVRGLLTHIGGGKPKALLPFSDRARCGPIQKFRFNNVTVEKLNINLPAGVVCFVSIENLENLHVLEIAEIHFCNPADFPFDVMIINGTKADEIVKIAEDTFSSFPVYRAIFRKPVILPTHKVPIVLKTSTYSGTAPSVRVVGSNNYQDIQLNSKSCRIRLEYDNSYSATAGQPWGFQFSEGQRKDSVSWHFLIGIRGRIRKYRPLFGPFVFSLK